MNQENIKKISSYALLKALSKNCNLNQIQKGIFVRTNSKSIKIEIFNGELLGNYKYKTYSKNLNKKELKEYLAEIIDDDLVKNLENDYLSIYRQFKIIKSKRERLLKLYKLWN